MPIAPVARPIALALAALALAALPCLARSDADLPALLAEADAAYARRDEPGALDQVREKLAAAEAQAPGNFAAAGVGSYALGIGVFRAQALARSELVRIGE